MVRGSEDLVAGLKRDSAQPVPERMAATREQPAAFIVQGKRLPLGRLLRPRARRKRRPRAQLSSTPAAHVDTPGIPRGPPRRARPPAPTRIPRAHACDPGLQGARPGRGPRPLPRVPPPAHRRRLVGRGARSFLDHRLAELADVARHDRASHRHGEVDDSTLGACKVRRYHDLSARKDSGHVSTGKVTVDQLDLGGPGRRPRADSLGVAVRRRRAGDREARVRPALGEQVERGHELVEPLCTQPVPEEQHALFARGGRGRRRENALVTVRNHGDRQRPPGLFELGSAALSMDEHEGHLRIRRCSKAWSEPEVLYRSSPPQRVRDEVRGNRDQGWPPGNHRVQQHRARHGHGVRIVVEQDSVIRPRRSSHSERALFLAIRAAIRLLRRR